MKLAKSAGFGALGLYWLLYFVSLPWTAQSGVL